MSRKFEDRATRIADLEIHGWEPIFVHGKSQIGIYNAALRIGFLYTYAPYNGTEIGRVGTIVIIADNWRTEWESVSDVALDAIDKRLAQV